MLTARWALTRFSNVIAAAAVAAITFGVAPPAIAQESADFPAPLVEVSGGYMFMRDFSDDLEEIDRDGINLPVGWYFSGAVNPTRWLGVVGEATGSCKNNLDVAMFGLATSSKLACIPRRAARECSG